MKIINATPHDIVFGEGIHAITFGKSEFLARVSVKEVEVEALADTFPCITQTFGEVEGLPAPKEGVVYIVSGMVKSASKRADLIAPDTGKTAIRNEKGHIVAVTRFVM